MEKQLEAIQSMLPILRSKLMEFMTSKEEIEILYKPEVAKIILQDETIKKILTMQDKIHNMPYWYDISIADEQNVIATFDYPQKKGKKQVMKHFILNEDNELELVTSWDVQQHSCKSKYQIVREDHTYLVIEDSYATKLYDYKEKQLIELTEKRPYDETYELILHNAKILNDKQKMLVKTVK